MITNWPTKKLGEVCGVIGGGTPSREDIQNFVGDIPWVTVKDLHVFEIEDTLEHINEKALENSAANLVPAYTVLVATRVGLGKIAISKRPLTFNQDIKGLKPHDEIDAYFLFYGLLINAHKIEENGVGATVKGITQEFLKDLKIAVPEKKIQKQIVERMDKIAEAQKLNDDLIQKTDELFQSLLHKELNPAGKNWEMKKLGDVIAPQYGYTAAAQDAGKYRFIRITDIDDFGELRNNDKRYVSINPGEANPYKLNAGDLLLARTGATFGKILYFKKSGPAIFASFLIRLNPDTSKLDPFYIWLFSRSRSYWRQANSLMTGSGQPQFNANKLKQIKIPLPPLKIQKHIVAKLSAVQEYKKQLLTQKSLFKELFDSVLSKSIGGQEYN